MIDSASDTGARAKEPPAASAEGADSKASATATAASASPTPKKPAPKRKAATRKRPAKKAAARGAGKDRPPGSRRGTRPFPASSFEDALALPNAIQRLGSGQRIRRLTLFDELGRSPDSSASRELIYSSSRYSLTKGSHTSEWLELTDQGNLATSTDAPRREQARARFSLALEQFAPFKSLFERYVTNKLPAQAVLRDHLVDAAGLDPDLAQEAVEMFIVNAKYLAVLKPVAGVERLLALDHVLDELPSGTSPSDRGASRDKRATGAPAAGAAEWARTCFYITPIGEEGTEQRKHADVFLASIVEPAIESLDRGFVVVRADHIERPGLITAQVIEHVFRSALVVVDLSFHNPNVFYELALRHASGKPTVLISRIADSLPFDVSDVRTVLLDTESIWAFVPQMETWKAEITSQARRALDDADGGANPLAAFFPQYREHLA